LVAYAEVWTPPPSPAADVDELNCGQLLLVVEVGGVANGDSPQTPLDVNCCDVDTWHPDVTLAWIPADARP